MFYYMYYLCLLVLSLIIAYVPCGGFYFVYSPGTAEALDVRDEGETVGFLPQKTDFTLVERARFKKRSIVGWDYLSNATRLIITT